MDSLPALAMADGEASSEQATPRNIEVYLRLRPVLAPAAEIAVDAAESRVAFTVQRNASSGRVACSSTSSCLVLAGVGASVT